jgi:hypothetical protein
MLPEICTVDLTYSVLHHKQKCVQQNEAYGPDLVTRAPDISDTSLTYLSLHVSYLVLQLPDFLAVIQVASKLSFSEHLFILRTMSDSMSQMPAH